MTLSALYSETVLAHNRAPQNKFALSNATHRALGENAHCGDQVRMHATCSDAGHVLACSFEGESCAICTAAASMLTEIAIGKHLGALEVLQAEFESLMQGNAQAKVPKPLDVFIELQHHPARRRCASLPLRALIRALHLPRIEMPASDVLIRVASEDDIPRIVALVESAYRGDGSKQGWTTEADMLDGQRTDNVSVATVIHAPDSRILVAERGDDLLGCVHVEGQQGVGYFGMFAVSPKAQGQGIGALLLNELERVARVEFACALMTMTVISIRKELIDFYLRRGYHATGQTKPFPYGDERFGIPKRADLEFAVFAKPLI